ncbi:hypothetical protein FPY71_17270 [Aureimonas fodinaquatilis]|uniref:C-type lysozyme inhibitor domain-containing protein n=1 Tax=Aureimonas fodinaquatilis TaxID=2565783 RepID=A0A5B0DP55_9HYPH|nr:MliC family protein [Aureimonas fodinaquatilis]KAA0968627.1 hypothetical protein FPY71_17270 [Aureimonas fodinaquatilis]
MRAFMIGMAILAGTGAAAAATTQLPLPGEVEEIRQTYQCSDDQARDVSYYNSEENSLAVVQTGDSQRIFVNVISGSGARYASGPYIWWVKGNDADLYDEMADKDAKPISCTGAKE